MATTLYYIRYSSSGQHDGQSVHRQTSMLNSYRLQHGLGAPDKVYSDLGISAFTGSNLEASLGELLKDLQSGLYEAPVTVLVESVDRISRGQIQDASALVQQLQTYCTLITVADGHRYEQGKFDLVGMITLLVKAATAREESEKKSIRSKATHAKAKAEGKRQNTFCKRWQHVSEDKSTVTVIQEEADIIRELFRLKRLGLGVRKLTGEAKKLVPPSKPPYTQSFICRLFHDYDLVTYGVISETDFIICKSELKSIKAGRPSNNLHNLFKGIFRCGCCGSAISYKAASSTSRQGYLICNARNLNGVKFCNLPMLNYERLEKLMLDALGVLSKELFTHKVVDVESMKRTKEDLEAKLITLNNRMKNIIGALSDMPEELATALTPIKLEITNTKGKLEEAVDAYEEAVANLENVSLEAPTTEEERIAFNLRLVKALKQFTVELSKDGERFRLRREDNLIALILDRGLTKWSFPTTATSVVQGPDGKTFVVHEEEF